MIKHNAQDIQQEVQQTLKRGELKWNTGSTYEEKQEGVKMIVTGLNTMKIWISRESDPYKLQTLNDIYNTKLKDVQAKLDYLEAAKQRTLPDLYKLTQPEVQINPQPQIDRDNCIDNSAIQKEVQLSLQKGNLKWDIGVTYEEKQDGVNTIIEGLKKMKTWISREYDPQRLQTLNDIYNNRLQDLNSKIDYLKEFKETLSGKIPVLESAFCDAFVQEKSNIQWQDIAGLAQVKEALQEAVVLPIKFPQMFQGVRKPWKGILLYGPPGTEKISLARACATEAEASFFTVSASGLIADYLGAASRIIQTLFAKACENRPSIIFIDDLDSINRVRQDEASRRLITEFLVQIDAVGNNNQGLIVLAATNVPWALDISIRKRFEKRIYIPLPDLPTRSQMFELMLKQNKHTISNQQMSDLGKRTEGYSGLDISVVVKDAVYEPVKKIKQCNRFKKIIIDGQEKLTPADPKDNGPQIVEINYMQIDSKKLLVPDITYNDCISALTKFNKSVSQEQIKQYEDWTKEFAQEG